MTDLGEWPTVLWVEHVKARGAQVFSVQSVSYKASRALQTAGPTLPRRGPRHAAAPAHHPSAVGTRWAVGPD